MQTEGAKKMGRFAVEFEVANNTDMELVRAGRCKMKKSGGSPFRVLSIAVPLA